MREYEKKYGWVVPPRSRFERWRHWCWFVPMAALVGFLLTRAPLATYIGEPDRIPASACKRPM